MWDVGGISQDLFMTNDYSLLQERHEACGAGLSSSKPLIYQLGFNSHPPDGVSSYLWAQQNGVCAECITTAFPWWTCMNSCRKPFVLSTQLVSFPGGPVLDEKFALRNPGICLGVPTCSLPPKIQTKKTHFLKQTALKCNLFPMLFK